MVCGAVLACVGWLLQPAAAQPENLLLLVQQQLPVIGQDPETAGKGEGPTGYVQPPEPRGQDYRLNAGSQGTNAGEAAPNQPSGALGANGNTNAQPGESTQAGTHQQAGRVDENQQAGQLPPGQNPQTPVSSALPGPSGTAPGEPSR
jgi:hypothetical protein